MTCALGRIVMANHFLVMSKQEQFDEQRRHSSLIFFISWPRDEEPCNLQKKLLGVRRDLSIISATEKGAKR